MTDDKPGDKSKFGKFSTRELIYGAILVFGFILVVSGLNGIFGWGLPEMATNAIGAVLGVAGAFGLAWLRKR